MLSTAHSAATLGLEFVSVHPTSTTFYLSSLAALGIGAYLFLVFDPESPDTKAVGRVAQIKKLPYEWQKSAGRLPIRRSGHKPTVPGGNAPGDLPIV